MQELTALTRRLVSIPSHGDETAAGDAIESWLEEHTDAGVTRDATGNVLARRGGGGTTLALVGHHDVVPPADRQVRGADGDGDRKGSGSESGPGVGTEYVVEERDGRLYGRGTADMKGAVAAMLLAFRDADLSPEPGLSTGPGVGDDADEPGLVFASFVGEEIGGVGARAAIDEGFAPDSAVVGEGSTGYSAPGLTDVAVAHKGRRGSTVVVRGESAHASVPQDGVNAVYSACDAVDRLREMEPPEADVFGERLHGTMAVTGIEGGSAWNVVPDRCEVTVDERTVPGERLFLEGLEEQEGVRVEVDQDLPPMACDDEGFAELVLGAAREAHSAESEEPRSVEPEPQSAESAEPQSAQSAEPGGATERDARPEFVTKPHATDAGWLSDAGTACVVCGPSEQGEAHTARESVSLDVLERCYRIYRGVAERFPHEGALDST